MKSNMVLVMAAIIAMFTLAVALAASATLLGPGPAATHGANNTSANVTLPADNATLSAPEAMTTAFGALNTSSGAAAVVDWMADKKIVYIASISSDFCEDGLSDTWTVTYASDDGQIIACVVSGEVVDVRQSLSSPRQGLDPSKAIDSTEIWQKMVSQAIGPGGEVPATASMTLKVTGGQPRWDISYEAADGLHVVRVDAGNGTVTDQVTIGQG
jgi:hypothetical protein